MAEEPIITPDDCCSNGTVKLLNDLDYFSACDTSIMGDGRGTNNNT